MGLFNEKEREIWPNPAVPRQYINNRSVLNPTGSWCMSDRHRGRIVDNAGNRAQRIEGRSPDTHDRSFEEKRSHGNGFGIAIILVRTPMHGT